ncbi:MAG: cobalamin biosynthesis protein CbiD [Candidatus Omnitrophica bacterium]|nr:cobalamin biosynthesis protein CbiD [Candidatus Omnitrophota bacterium]
MSLKKGYTTGTCAQAATKAACLMLTGQKPLGKVEVITASGVKLRLKLGDQKIRKNSASCSVIKDAGDDIDVTHGMKIYSQARVLGKTGIILKGGRGVGKVTKPGLAVGVGDWAINPVPRRMILQEASRILPKGKGFEVIISVPGGKELAKRTYNPKLGIIGGISIIGTTGIVKPKSLDAYKASLALELDVLKARGYNKVTVVLGYVGDRFCKETLRLKDDAIIKVGDHIGFILKECAKRRIKEVLLIGHIGKLIKVANGQFNTHYAFGDNRVSSIARYAELRGAGKKVIKDVSSHTTAEAAAGVLKKAGLAGVFERIAKDVSAKAEEFTGNKIKVDSILLSLDGKVLGMS